MNNVYFLLTTSIMNTMFFTSGLDKIMNYTKVVNGLEKRLNKTIPYTSILIMCAIVIEIMCPLVIFFCIWKRSKQNDRKGMYASIILMMFTVMATLFYHFPPTTSAKYYPFMSNLALIGGLGLMTLVFNGNVLF
jgi:uncharacterized membrane protein YphA (DoxX/SURF4 family)